MVSVLTHVSALPVRNRKLIRDRIPEIAAADGLYLAVRQAAPDELPQLITEKLLEEAQEFALEPSLDELADVLEVIGAACHCFGWSSDQLEAAREAKRSERGAFDNRFVLENRECTTNET